MGYLARLRLKKKKNKSSDVTQLVKYLVSIQEALEPVIPALSQGGLRMRSLKPFSVT